MFRYRSECAQPDNILIHDVHQIWSLFLNLQLHNCCTSHKPQFPPKKWHQNKSDKYCFTKPAAVKLPMMWINEKKSLVKMFWFNYKWWHYCLSLMCYTDCEWQHITTVYTPVAVQATLNKYWINQHHKTTRPQVCKVKHETSAQHYHSYILKGTVNLLKSK